jgi:hypothetical protein
MNRKNLTAAVLAGLAGVAGIVGSAQAVNINPDGLGQVLIYPYYTTNGGNATVLSVINTTGQAKAVKVRFTEGLNTREVLDFNLYMSKYDVWTAALYDDEGTPTMVTTDTSCTVPYIYGNGGTQAFLPFALTDGGPTDISRTSEGHFEMIEMGTLTNESEYIGEDASGNPVVLNHDSAKAATHVDGVPADCGQLVEAWTWEDTLDIDTQGYWLDNPFVDMDDPSGGLFGGAAIVNPSAGTMYSYDAKAIDGFATRVIANDILHQEPGRVLPSLNSGNVKLASVFVKGVTVAEILPRGVDAVSFVFMHDQIMNEYTTEGFVDAGTEWVVTFPTKHFYVYGPSIGLLPGDDVIAVPPFTTTWDYTAADEDASGNVIPAELNLPCEVVLLNTIWNREEATIPGPDDPTGGTLPPIVSPAPPFIPGPGPDPLIPFELCYETNVISFGEADEASIDGTTTRILGSSNFHNIDNKVLGFKYGWARLELDDYPYDRNGNGQIDNELVDFETDASGNTVPVYLIPESELSRIPLGELGTGDLGGLQGLPVTGFAVQAFVNGFLGEGSDVLANYGGIFQHKGTRKIDSANLPTGR